MKAFIAASLLVAASAACVQQSPLPSATPPTKTYFFGNNFYGQLGFAENNTVNPKFSYIGSSATTRNSKCVGGFMNSAAILVGPPDKVFLSGDGASGQLGFGPAYETTFRRFLPPADSLPYLSKDSINPVPLNLNVVDVCQGWSHTCIIVSATATPNIRKVMCSGKNNVGQLGVSSFIADKYSRFQPVLNSRRDGFDARTDDVFNRTVNFKSIHCGGDFTIGLTTDGLLYGWGSNALGQLGRGSASVVDLATQIDLPGLAAGDFVAQVATGFAFTVVVTDKGVVYVFGSNAERQLGLGDTPAKVTTPTKATGTLADLGPTIRQVSCGGYHCVAIAGGNVRDSSSGRAYSWGEGTLGQTGQPVPDGKAGTRWYVLAPTQIPGLSGDAVNTIATGFKHTLVLTNCGEVYAFGSDAFGQLGLGGSSPVTNFRAMSPTLVPKVKDWNLSVRGICSGAFHSAIIAVA